APPDADGLRSLAHRLRPLGPVRAAIESMNGARFVHDQLELPGWDVEIAGAQKAKGLAPLACKTDKIDAGRARRALPTVSGAGDLATGSVGASRAGPARFRLHLSSRYRCANTTRRLPDAAKSRDTRSAPPTTLAPPTGSSA